MGHRSYFQIIYIPSLQQVQTTKVQLRNIHYVVIEFLHLPKTSYKYIQAKCKRNERNAETKQRGQNV